MVLVTIRSNEAISTRITNSGALELDFMLPVLPDISVGAPCRGHLVFVSSTVEPVLIFGDFCPRQPFGRGQRALLGAWPSPIQVPVKFVKPLAGAAATSILVEHASGLPFDRVPNNFTILIHLETC